MLKYCIVNELSGTMDLESTLVRAESLFRRFQRTVEMVDKKGNFPSPPQAKQRRPVSSPGPSGSDTQAVTSVTDNGKQPVSQEETRIISPELRALLSRKVEKVDKEALAKQSGGK